MHSTPVFFSLGRPVAVAIVATLLALGASPSLATPGDCGQPTSRGASTPSATDSLFVLRAAVGIGTCKPCVCDTDASGLIAATDALAILRSAVGLGPSLACGAVCDPLCGDGLIDLGEDCDSSGESDSCDADCTVAYCSDGTLNSLAGEICDEGPDSAGCDADCTPTRCGDDVINPSAGEQCEDGNAVDGDGCDTSCTLTACGNGIVTAGEACDDGGPSAACDSDCTPALCGDGIRNAAAGEGCDAAGGDSVTCDLDCTVAFCGDRRTNPLAGEACDDGNTSDGDGCEASCVVTPACGNGFREGSELCDDGNFVSGDGCSEACATETCTDVGGAIRCLACPAGTVPDAAATACVCAPGFERIEETTDSGTVTVCIDTDECAAGLHACADAARCVNTPGGYSCAIDCTPEALQAALESCGAPTGVITFACNDAVIAIPPSDNLQARTATCDDLVVDGLDRNVTFELDPPCYESPVPAEDCTVALAEDGTCACPAVDRGDGFLRLHGDRNVVRNLTVKGFFEGVHLAGRESTVEHATFERVCDDAVGNIDGGVGSVFRNLVVTKGCDKCSESFGEIALTHPDPRLRTHYNAIFRDIAFSECQQPLRMTEGGRFLIDRVDISGGATGLFSCSGPRFTSIDGEALVIEMRDSTIRDCRRGLRIGGGAEALVYRNRFESSSFRGVLVTASGVARLWDNLIVGNGGAGNSEPGFGGVVATVGGRIDLGGGLLSIDGMEGTSPGGNAICDNFAPGGLRADVANETESAISAIGNYWCTIDPSSRLSGSVVATPALSARAVSAARALSTITSALLLSASSSTRRRASYLLTTAC